MAAHGGGVTVLRDRKNLQNRCLPGTGFSMSGGIREDLLECSVHMCAVNCQFLNVLSKVYGEVFHINDPHASNFQFW